MKLKNLAIVGFSLLICLSTLAACGGGAQPAATQAPAAAAPTTAPAEQVKLRVLAGQSTTDSGIEDMIDAALAKKHPNIKLEWECVDWGTDFQPKMQVYMQSGLPDIMIGKAQDVSTYGGLGLLADLTGKAYLNEVLEASIPGVTLGGKVLGVTYNALYQGVYYNRKLFTENGWTAPDTIADLQKIIDAANAKGITPFASHMVDTWSIGNVTMQFAVNDVFTKTPDWGDQFRQSKVNFIDSAGYRACYEYNKLIFDNTWKDETFSLEQTSCDARMVQGKAAMKVSGSWSIQNFLDVDESFDFGIFPFPNQSGDSKLLFEPNITFMASAASPSLSAVDNVLDIITGDKALGVQIYDFTKTAPMIKGATPTFPNPSQADIDKYAAQGRIQDVNLGNNQLQWGGFQEENAKDIAEYLQGNISLDDALKASDARRANSKA
ncbi:MAG: extracellular solute-binding protein [Clostridiales bacterium]|jgi:ABC-type glycerol-3-phosphate transport system substrate-binding protein|nr:extracellular solute-binding protein [Clostridiales bacterium]